jgi:hypothetical protein
MMAQSEATQARKMAEMFALMKSEINQKDQQPTAARVAPPRPVAKAMPTAHELMVNQLKEKVDAFERAEKEKFAQQAQLIM